MGKKKRAETFLGDSLKPDAFLKLRNKKIPNFMSKKSQNGLPKNATRVMNEWLFANRYHPYPNEATKLQLQIETKLSPSQVSNFFINARRRHLLDWLQYEGKTESEIRDILKCRGNSAKVRPPLPTPTPGLDFEGVVAFFRNNLKSSDMEKLPENKDQVIYQVYFNEIYAKDPANRAVLSDSNAMEIKAEKPNTAFRPRTISSCSQSDNDNKENMDVDTSHLESSSSSSEELEQCAGHDSDYYTSSSVPATPSPAERSPSPDTSFTNLYMLANCACFHSLLDRRAI